MLYPLYTCTNAVILSIWSVFSPSGLGSGSVLPDCDQHTSQVGLFFPFVKPTLEKQNPRTTFTLGLSIIGIVIIMVPLFVLHVFYSVLECQKETKNNS